MFWLFNWFSNDSRTSFTCDQTKEATSLSPLAPVQTPQQQQELKGLNDENMALEPGMSETPVAQPVSLNPQGAWDPQSPCKGDLRENKHITLPRFCAGWGAVQICSESPLSRAPQICFVEILLYNGQHQDVCFHY